MLNIINVNSSLASFIDSVLKDGAERADAMSAPVIREVRELVGFWGA